MGDWPTTSEELIQVQEELRCRKPAIWRPGVAPITVGACFVCFGRGSTRNGARGDIGWAGAALWHNRQVIATATAKGAAGAPYSPGLLALREGPLLEAAVRALPTLPDVLLVNATGRDHPRRAGLALHLGAVLNIPTVGVTNRPLLAQGEWPAPDRGSTSPLWLEAENVAVWLRTRAGAHPLVIHPAWRTDLAVAVTVAQSVSLKARTPEPLRHARHLARTARAHDQGNSR
ncbi:MAG: endonuclease V [Candidatus Neomarinimicrobiota bacterium]